MVIVSKESPRDFRFIFNGSCWCVYSVVSPTVNEEWTSELLTVDGLSFDEPHLKVKNRVYMSQGYISGNTNRRILSREYPGVV